MDGALNSLQGAISDQDTMRGEHAAGMAALRLAMKLHAGHMDGTVQRSPDSNAQMTGLLNRAHKAMQTLATAV